MNERMPPCDVLLPPWFFRLFPDLSNAALRVTFVVLAETAGWDAESAILSRADFAALSGLAQSSVQSGIEEALQAQILQRVPVGTSYAYRVKAPTDLSAFPTTPSRNVTALRQLHRLQERLSTQIELERAALERGSYPSLNGADGLPVKGDDRNTVRLSEQTDIGSDRNPAPALPTDNSLDRNPVNLSDPMASKPSDPARAVVEPADLLPVSANDLDLATGQGRDRHSVTVDPPTVKPSVSARSDARLMIHFRFDRQSVKPPVTLCEEAVSPASPGPMCAGAPRKKFNNLFPGKYTNTVWGKCEHGACVRGREATHLSVFSYSEVLAYAKSLKGIRNPGGLAVVYWRSGEMDGEIVNFQQRQAARAEQQAAEEAERAAEMRAEAREILARGEPFAAWEREFMAAFATEFEEEHNVQIQRLDAGHSNVV